MKYAFIILAVMLAAVALVHETGCDNENSVSLATAEETVPTLATRQLARFNSSYVEVQVDTRENTIGIAVLAYRDNLRDSLWLEYEDGVVYVCKKPNTLHYYFDAAIVDLEIPDSGQDQLEIRGQDGSFFAKLKRLKINIQTRIERLMKLDRKLISIETE